MPIYAVARGQEVIGEYSSEEVSSMIRQGKLLPSDLVYTESFDNWKSIGEIPELNNSPTPSSNEGFGFTLKSKWHSGSAYEKTVFASSGVAILSMFMNWVETGLGSASGIQQMAFLFLGLFVYPIRQLLKGSPIKKSWGIGCGICSILLAVIYIESKEVILFGDRINVSGDGPLVFIVASIAMMIGVIGIKNTNGQAIADKVYGGPEGLVEKLKKYQVAGAIVEKLKKIRLRVPLSL